MKRKGFKIAGMVLLGIGAAVGFTFAVMLLWNSLIPSIFGLGIISFWQALGLLVLSRLLFGGFGHSGGHRFGGMHHRKGLREKWTSMTPEERKEFISKRKERMCGGRFGRRHFFDDRDFDFERTDFDKKDNE
ncbi:hypothetical protein C8C85_1386 [Flavobacterium sp. 103]|uniref:hypothetical protein n=1 Tax=Flavobacterium sp. 103 TaxID=2135624 RepID=UPI000D5DC219|nr:hypothetical protein [Flavobacterium sp. 103]PVX45588.1 hypothetical protein C8C85_1386 [Flavobacterium sp. 103]